MYITVPPGRKFWDAEITMTPSAGRYQDAAQLTAPYDRKYDVELTIFVSCYNEEAYIKNTLDTVNQAMAQVGCSYEVIVIDDGSKDRSRDIVKEYIAAHPEMNIILRANARNKGLAQNYIDGAFLGKGKYYRLLCGDNSEPVESLVRVFGAIGSADIIIPYYSVNSGRGIHRYFISWLYTGIINFLTGNRLHYYNGLAVHLRHNVLRWHPNTHGFGFQADLLCHVIDLGFSYKEVAITASEKREGRSSAITMKNLLSVMHTMLEILLRRVSHRVYKRWRVAKN